MPPKRHVPANDAPASEWQEYLRGVGYLPESEPKPFSNYKALHGFWVPPRVGPKEPGPQKVTRGRVADRVDPRWYSVEKLTHLYQVDRETFGMIRDRVDHVERTASGASDAERVADQRVILEAAVEAGLMSSQEAGERLATWAEEHGVAL